MPTHHSLTATSASGDVILPSRHTDKNRIIDHVRTAARLAVGVLLLIAAGLKLAGQNVSAVPQVGWYATPIVQMAAAEWELVLGIWLLSGRYRIGSWLASVATFLTFAAISGYLGFVGVASCGCFGAIKASPWYAFGVDAVALLFLGPFRPNFSSLRQMTRTECHRLALNGAAYTFAIGTLLIASTGAATWVYGSPEAALARLRGETIIISPSNVDFGLGELGEALSTTVEVRNWSARPVRLVGGTSDCSCVVTKGLPCHIPAGESRTIPIQMQIKWRGVGAVTRRAELIWTDDDHQKKVRFSLGVRVK